MGCITVSNWLSGCIDICLHLKNDLDASANNGDQLED